MLTGYSEKSFLALTHAIEIFTRVSLSIFDRDSFREFLNKRPSSKHAGGIDEVATALRSVSIIHDTETRFELPGPPQTEVQTKEFSGLSQAISGIFKKVLLFCIFNSCSKFNTK